MQWLLWWQTDADEIERQATDYHDLTFFKSARGVATALLIFSAVLSAAFIFFDITGPLAAIDIVAMIVLAMFIYMGHRWASVAAMILWTITKAMMVIDAAQGGAGTPIGQVIWWCIYMHAFWVAFHVERRRRMLEQR